MKLPEIISSQFQGDVGPDNELKGGGGGVYDGSAEMTATVRLNL